MTHTRSTSFAGAIATGCLVVAAIAAPSAALAAPGGGQQVTICHATNSDDRPYSLETVSVSATGELGRGHSGHTGPIWSASLKAAHVAWGDIIPAYDFETGSFAGQNLDNGGQAILDAGCVVTVAAESTPSVSPTDAAPTDAAPTDAAATDETPTDAAPTDETPTDSAPTDAAPTDETPTDETPTDADPSDGGLQVIVDPSFVTESPAATPATAAKGGTTHPHITPPPTDTVGETSSSTTGTGFRMLLLVLAGLCSLVLLAGRVPAVRRS